MKVLFKRADGTFVAEINGHPYHVIPEDAELFALAQEAGGDAPFEPQPEPLPPPSADQLLSHLAAHRWAVETGGVDIGGMTVATDDRSKTMILGARVEVMLNPDYVTSWKMPDGTWMPLDAATITAVSKAVLDHVNWCFARESEVAELITAGDITDYDGVEAAFDI